MSNSLLPIGEEWSVIKNMAGILIKSGLLPRSVDTPEKAVAIMLKGREMSIPPMQAFAKISIIQGVPTMNAELMLSLVRRELPGAKIIFKTMTDSECVISAARPGEELANFSFTMKDAQNLGLSGKDNYKKQPKVMLKWRCVSEVCRTLFSDCLMGVSYTPEELNPDVKVSEDGHVIDVETRQEVKNEQATLGSNSKGSDPNSSEQNGSERTRGVRSVASEGKPSADPVNEFDPTTPKS